MLEAIYKEQRANGDRAIEALKKDFTTLRTGKVSVAILDHIFVDYYGSQTPLNQVATVLSTDAVTISITPWEKPMLKAIESAIAAANIGVNPTNDGESVKLFFPPMTVRKDANDEIKKLEKDKAISEDDAKKGYDEVQKITDSYSAKIDDAVKAKEAELLKV